MLHRLILPAVWNWEQHTFYILFYFKTFIETLTVGLGAKGMLLCVWCEHTCLSSISFIFTWLGGIICSVRIVRWEGLKGSCSLWLWWAVMSLRWIGVMEQLIIVSWQNFRILSGNILSPRTVRNTVFLPVSIFFPCLCVQVHVQSMRVYVCVCASAHVSAYVSVFDLKQQVVDETFLPLDVCKKSGDHWVKGLGVDTLSLRRSLAGWLFLNPLAPDA